MPKSLPLWNVWNTAPGSWRLWRPAPDRTWLTTVRSTAGIQGSRSRCLWGRGYISHRVSKGTLTSQYFILQSTQEFTALSENTRRSEVYKYCSGVLQGKTAAGFSLYCSCRITCIHNSCSEQLPLTRQQLTRSTKTLRGHRHHNTLQSQRKIKWEWIINNGTYAAWCFW